MNARRHGWQRPLHPLQMVGMVVYSLLVAAFYCFLGPLLGNRIAEITVITIFSLVALSVMLLFIRCTAIDPSDKTRCHRKRRQVKTKACGSKLNYGFILGQIVIRTLRRMERKLLKTCIRRKYLLDPRITHVHMEPLLPFPLVVKDDSISPDPKEEDTSFCSLCDFQVSKHSKHCRTCNRCVEGFDHHCRWLNNCVGKKNYSSFFLLLAFVLLMLIVEGGTAMAIFIRCFADKRSIEKELARELHVKFPRVVLAAISVMLVLMTAYGSAALGQLFFFHVVLIRKGMRTYDYILAMKEENQFSRMEPLNDSDFSSDDSSEPASPKRPFMSKFRCQGGLRTKSSGGGQLFVTIDPESGPSLLKHNNQGFRASINPWKLIQLSREKALQAVAKAKEKQKQTELLNPLPFETKSGPLVKPPGGMDLNKSSGLSSTPLIPKGSLPGSPTRISSPRRRFSGSPATTAINRKYKSNFDLKLTEVSKELEAYISRQVLCSVLKDGTEASPR